MRTPDLIRSAVGGLWRQKARTALTLLGVAVGSCVLAFSLALGLGLRELIDREFQSKPSFWQVHVRVAHRGSAVPESEIPPEEVAVEGEMSEERRRRLRAWKVKRYQDTQPRRPPVPLTPARVAELAAVPDVAEVLTWHVGAGRVWLGDQAREATVVSGRVPAADLGRRLVAGRLPADDAADEVLVSETLLYELGVRGDAEVEAMIGRPVRVGVGGAGMTRHLSLAWSLGVRPTDVGTTQEQVLGKIAAQLPAALDKLDLTPAERAALKAMFAERDKKKGEPDRVWPSDAARADLRVAGVLRDPTPDEEEELSRFEGGWNLARPGVLLPQAAGDRLFGQLPWVRETGYSSVTLQVRPGGDLRAVAAAAEGMGFMQHSAVEWFDLAKREVTLIAAGMNLFALASLFIAALGITNTLVTGVVERTREIGVLKAIGATDRQVMGLFLAEGALIGLIGGLLGLGLTWGLSIPGDGYVRRLVEEQSRQPLVSESAFLFPLWLPAATVGFAALVTTLAAVYPARRAARLDPVEALRHG